MADGESNTSIGMGMYDMQNIEQRIEAWRNEMGTARQFSQEQLAELESHLRESIEAATSENLTDEEVFALATYRLGQAKPIAHEYAKVQRNISYKHHIIGGIFIIALAWISLPNNPHVSYIHLPSLAFVAGIVISGLWLSFGPASMIRTIQVSITGRVAPSDDLALFITVLRRGRALAWSCGLLAALLGAISILSSVGDPVTFGQGLGLAIYTTLYGVLLAELFFSVLIQRLARCITQRELAA